MELQGCLHSYTLTKNDVRPKGWLRSCQTEETEIILYPRLPGCKSQRLEEYVVWDRDKSLMRWAQYQNAWPGWPIPNLWEVEKEGWPH